MFPLLVDLLVLLLVHMLMLLNHRFLRVFQPLAMATMARSPTTVQPTVE